MMKSFKIDSKGNIIIGTIAILIISLLLISIFVIVSINYIENENIDSKANDNFKYIIDDYNNNLEIISRDSIDKITDRIYNGLKISDSRKEIKKVLNKKLDKKNKEYKQKYDVNIHSEVLSIKNTADPIKYLFKFKINVKKENEEYNGVLEKNVSIEGLRDPLPIAKLGPLYGISFDDNRIYYNNGLTIYLKLHKIESAESYLYATTPTIIKKCPFDPYIHHGDGDTLKNCLKNGYFHESRDGSCYLCRLEGKGTCSHYGLEVFIHPHTILKNDSVSCVDHVVFHDHYLGEKLDDLDINSLILDSSHGKKYGLI